ncbi:MAG: hypothetical protein Kow0029_22680 [Candidatus Rifleibacteriota bacterium]
MDEVEFRHDNSPNQSFSFSGPSAPVDPETGDASPLENKIDKGIFKKPKFPDFSKLREKAAKSSKEQRDFDSEKLQTAFESSETQKTELEKDRNKLIELLKTISDPVEKAKLVSEKANIDQKLDAIEQLIKIFGNSSGSFQSRLSQLTDQEFKQALELQKLILGRPSDQKAKSAPPNTQAANDNGFTPQKKQRFYKPGKFNSFYLEAKKQKLQASQEKSSR